MNKFEKIESFDKLSNQNFNQGEYSVLDKSVRSDYSFEKFIENGVHYYISDSSELGIKKRPEKCSSVSIGILINFC